MGYISDETDDKYLQDERDAIVNEPTEATDAELDFPPLDSELVGDND